MKKKFSCIVLIAFILSGMIFQTVNAATSNSMNLDKAGKLQLLGIFSGSNKGFELDKPFTKLDASMVLVNLLGKKEYIKKNAEKHQFKDVPSSANAAIGYLYKNKYVVGSNATKFGINDIMTAEQFTAYLLKALGYMDGYNTGTTLDYAWDVGLINETTYRNLKTSKFIRDNAVGLIYDALSVKMKGTTRRLVNKLIDEKAFTKEKAEQAGVETIDDYYIVKNYGKIANVQAFDKVTVSIDQGHGGKYTVYEKNLTFKFDRNSMPEEMRNFTKVDVHEPLGVNIDSKVIESEMALGKQWMCKVKDDNTIDVPIGPNSTNVVLEACDDKETVLGYVVIKLLGFNVGNERYPNLIHRYEQIDMSKLPYAKDLNVPASLKFVEASGVRFDGRYVQVHFDKSKVPPEIGEIKYISLGAYYSWDKNFLISNKDSIVAELTKEDGGGHAYSDDDQREWSGRSLWMLITIYDQTNTKKVGYCLLHEKIPVGRAY